MRRVCCSSAVAVFILALTAAPGWACIEPEIGVSQDPVHPGDPVYFTIINLTPDPDQPAEWTVKVDETPVASGKTSNATDHGQFPMPDAGASATSVSVQLVVKHHDIENVEQTLAPPASSPIQYAGRSVASAPGDQQQPASPTTAPVSAESQTQHAGSASPAPPSTAPGQGDARRPRTPRKGGPTPTREPDRVRHPTRALDPHVLATRPQAAATPGDRARDAVTAQVIPAAAVTGASARSSSRDRHRAAREQVAPSDARPPVVAFGNPAADAAAPGARTATHAVSRAWPGIAALMVLLAAAMFRWRRRFGGASPGATPPSPPPPDQELAIEAELQELIAEEKARQSTVSGAASSP
jgi:hypothetical protein